MAFMMVRTRAMTVMQRSKQIRVCEASPRTQNLGEELRLRGLQVELTNQRQPQELQSDQRKYGEKNPE